MFLKSLAPPLTIIVTMIFLGYNVIQLSYARMQVIDQVGAYRDFIREQQVGIRILRKLNFRVLVFLIAFYLVLLFFSGFAWWFLFFALVKSGLSAWVSDIFHVRAIVSKKVSQSLLWMRRLDAVGNSLLLSLVLYLVVFA
ncbi:MAG: hypothetical protein GX801_09030 [Fibrobacter sp.]|nr:hypothetical protein [Fibrobacter sp.]